MTLQEIKSCVDSGKKVYWKNKGYQVIKDNLGRYLISWTVGDWWWLLAPNIDVLEDNEEDFFTE